MSRSRLSHAAVIRLATVVCINGVLFAIGAISIVTTFRAQRTDPVLHYQAVPVLSLEHVLWLLPLLLGIVAELFRWRVAKYINVGYFAVTAVWMIVALFLSRFHVWGFGEPEHWAPAVMLIGAPAACVAVLLGWLYRVVDERHGV